MTWIARAAPIPVFAVARSIECLRRGPPCTRFASIAFACARRPLVIAMQVTRLAGTHARQVTLSSRRSTFCDAGSVRRGRSKPAERLRCRESSAPDLSSIEAPACRTSCDPRGRPLSGELNRDDAFRRSVSTRPEPRWARSRRDRRDTQSLRKSARSATRARACSDCGAAAVCRVCDAVATAAVTCATASLARMGLAERVRRMYSSDDIRDGPRPRLSARLDVSNQRRWVCRSFETGWAVPVPA